MGNSAQRLSNEAAASVDLSVVVVCMNNRAYLVQCMESLHSANLRSRFEVVVVDNGSTDGTQGVLAERFPGVAVVQNSSNVGLSRATNQGIARARARYVLLLNDDTLVNGPSLDTMVEFLDHHGRVGAVACFSSGNLIASANLLLKL